MARRGDVRRPPSDALFAFPCRLRRIRRIKALHITKQNIVLIVWRRLCKATNSFLQKKKKIRNGDLQSDHAPRQTM
jgi:hypothetical protein